MYGMPGGGEESEREDSERHRETQRERERESGKKEIQQDHQGRPQTISEEAEFACLTSGRQKVPR